MAANEHTRLESSDLFVVVMLSISAIVKSLDPETRARAIVEIERLTAGKSDKGTEVARMLFGIPTT